MISEARKIGQCLKKILNTDDYELLLNLSKHKETIKKAKKNLEKIFREDHTNLKKKSNFDGLNNKYSRLETDWVYKVSQAFLHTFQIKESKNDKFICVVARTIICHQNALKHLDMMARLISELERSSSFIKDLENIEPSKIKELFKVGKKVDRIKGYVREASVAINEYCHFLDLAHYILGDKPEIHGKRFKADVYTFQLDTAIKELFTSRTESCDAAPFLIRSRLEIGIRRLLFDNKLFPSADYIPTPKLSLPELLKSCNRVDIEFSCPNEIINVVFENLNLVVHFGFSLNSSLLWYCYSVATSLLLIDNASTEKERISNIEKKIIHLFEDLEDHGYVKKLEETEYFQKCLLT